MSFEDTFASYWNLIFIAPLGFLLHKFVNHSSRISTLEANQKIYMKKSDEMCKSNEKLRDEVKTMIGRMDEHLKK